MDNGSWLVMRPKYVIGNWKMFTSISEGRKLAEDVHKFAQLHVAGSNVRVAVCPPFTHLTEVAHVLKESLVKMGAQDCHFENEGAHTGDVSPVMLAGAGAQYCMVGHSERRANHHEDNRIVNAKLLAAMRNNLLPILCFGETAAEKSAGKTHDVITRALKECLGGISRETMGKIILAYEPVWAISTNKDNKGAPATPQDANSVHQFIRNTLKEMFGAEVANQTIILYGGSVKPEKAFFSQSDIDGALVGGASLKKDSFAAIIEAAKA